jgi:hypothetical protein
MHILMVVLKPNVVILNPKDPNPNPNPKNPAVRDLRKLCLRKNINPSLSLKDPGPDLIVAEGLQGRN